MKNKVINKNNIRWVITGVVIALIGYAYIIATGILGFLWAWANFAHDGGSIWNALNSCLISLNEAGLNVIFIVVLFAISIALFAYFYKKRFSHKIKNWICLIIGSMLGAIIFSYLAAPALVTIGIIPWLPHNMGEFSIQHNLLLLSMILLWMTVCYFIAWIARKK